MWLECEYEPSTRIRLSGRTDRRGDFSGMVAVVVNQRERAAGRVNFSVVLKAAFDSFEFRERFGDYRKRDRKLQSHRDGSECVLHVVHPGKIESDLVAGARQLEAHLSAVMADMRRPHFRILGQTVGGD